MVEKVSAVTLANVARNWMDAYNDVELSCPPDDSDSWPDDSTEMVAYRDECEGFYKDLIALVQKYGIVDDL